MNVIVRWNVYDRASASTEAKAVLLQSLYAAYGAKRRALFHDFIETAGRP